jgi:hypothetical protein
MMERGAIAEEEDEEEEEGEEGQSASK